MPNVIFNGTTKTISLVQGVTYFDVESDIYSEWKNWALVNAQFPQAMKSSGGEPLPGDKATGKYFFLTNGWKLVANELTTGDIEIEGNLFSEDGSNVFQTGSVQLIRLTTSQLSNISFVSGSGGGGLTPSQENQLTSIQTTTTTIDNKLTYQSSSLLEQSSSLSFINTNVNVLLQQSGSGLTSTQATMLLELYNIFGLDPTKPLVVSTTSRQTGDINQSIDNNNGTVTVTRI